MFRTRQLRRTLFLLVAAVLGITATYHFLLAPFLAAQTRSNGTIGAPSLDEFAGRVPSLTLQMFAGVTAVGIVLAAFTTLGHLLGRYVRRPGPTQLSGPLGAWVLAQRERRAPVSLEIVLGRDDRASPYEVSKLLDGLIGALRPRWYERLTLGPDTFTLTLLNDPEARTFRMLAGVRADTASAFEHRLRATYPDVRTRPFESWADQLVAHRRAAVKLHRSVEFDVTRLKKSRRWMWSLQTTRDYEHSLVEALAATMAGSGYRCLVTIALTPAPLLLERHAARQLRGHEQGLNQAAAGSVAEPGAASAVEQRHIQGAVEAVGRSLAFFDVRIVVPRGRGELARQLAGVTHEARSENDLKRRQIRLRRRLILARIARHQPPLTPALRTGVLSTAELATLWHLPTLRLKGVGLQRSGSRRIAASPAISRDRQHEVLHDELGPVGIRPQDRKFGWAILGGQRVGKSSLLLRTIANVARDRDSTLIVIDPKVDLARDALTTIPTDRTAHYLDLGSPRIGFNPLTVLRSRDVSPEVVADMVVTAIRETAGETSVGARSDQFLRSAISAVCTVEDEPTLAHAHRMLDPDDASYRDWVVRELGYHPEAHFLRDFWGRSFQARIKTNPKFVAEIIEAPRNKLSRFLAVESLSYLTSHPVPLDLAGLVDRAEVLVINGSKGAVGEDNAVLICQLIVLAIQKLLHQQQDLERGSRRRVALIVDEAHNIFTPSFATMLSEGGAGGVEVTAAFQYSGQIEDDRVRTGIRSLLQNITIFRLREFEDARAAAALAMIVFTDTISDNDEAADRIRVDPADIVNQPNYQATNLWIADGRPQDVFTATTTAVEPLIATADAQGAAEHHLVAQRRRGYHPHDHGLNVPEPAFWSIEPGIITLGRRVLVDLTAWKNAPIEGAPLLRLRARDGTEFGYPLHRADASGRRFAATVPSDPAAPLHLPDGTYEVATSLGSERWQPTVAVHVRGNEYRRHVATATIRTLARRTPCAP